MGTCRGGSLWLQTIHARNDTSTNMRRAGVHQCMYSTSMPPQHARNSSCTPQVASTSIRMCSSGAVACRAVHMWSKDTWRTGACGVAAVYRAGGSPFTRAGMRGVRWARSHRTSNRKHRPYFFLEIVSSLLSEDR